ncbi:MAG: methyltransferase domain-containing protein [Candidatus Wallbacteria bacterium]
MKKDVNIWDVEQIKKFWNWYSSNPYLKNIYFTKQVGNAIVNMLCIFGKINGNLLDYGCGTGELLFKILKKYKKIECYGADYSDSSIKLTNNKLINFNNWKGSKIINGLPLKYDNETFDIITCIEVLEHMTSEDLTLHLKEFFRILKNKGILFITVPNDENLEENYVYCPNCEFEFHRVQHLNSYSVNKISKILNEMNFKVEFCASINLYNFQYSIKNFLLSFIERLICNFSKKLYINYSYIKNKIKKQPHLIVIASPNK